MASEAIWVWVVEPGFEPGWLREGKSTRVRVERDAEQEERERNALERDGELVQDLEIRRPERCRHALRLRRAKRVSAPSTTCTTAQEVQGEKERAGDARA